METQVITKDALRILLANQRQDIRRGLVTVSEAREILGATKNVFPSWVKKYSISRSETNPRLYIYSSVIKAFEKIHGYKYKDAIVN